MDQRSVFFDEWLRSLREQYKHVIRSGDKITLPSLTAVMNNVGFGEDELKQLRLEATIRAEDMPADYVPDLNTLDSPLAASAHPAECLCPSCASQDDGAHDADGQPMESEPDDEDRRVFPAAEIAQLEPEAENEPVTFEDSLELEAEAIAEDDSQPTLDAEIETDVADPDVPAQKSLF